MMKTFAIVPIKRFENAKTRLSSILDTDDRIRLSLLMLEEKERGVNSAVALADSYCMKKAADATMVIPHDLPLLNSTDISKACELAENESRCIVICPSLRYDGTNMLLRKPPSIIATFY